MRSIYFSLRGSVLTAAMTALFGTSLSALACDIKNPDDPFAKPAAMSSGPYMGHCIDTNRYRAALRLTDEQKAAFFTADELKTISAASLSLNDPAVEVLANFQGTDAAGADHFWVAVIPKERIKRAIMQITGLSKIAPIDHGQIRLDTSAPGRPILLFDQSKTLPRLSTTLNDDIVMTISGVRPMDHDEGYDAVKGLRPGYYDEIYSIGSQQSETINWITSAHLTTDEYLLNITQSQAQEALSTGLSIATERGVTYAYSTLTSSCLNLAFLVLHDVTKTNDTTWGMVFQSATPMLALQALGLINPVFKTPWSSTSWIDRLPVQK